MFTFEKLTSSDGTATYIGQTDRQTRSQFSGTLKGKQVYMLAASLVQQRACRDRKSSRDRVIEKVRWNFGSFILKWTKDYFSTFEMGVFVRENTSKKLSQWLCFAIFVCCFSYGTCNQFSADSKVRYMCGLFWNKLFEIHSTYLLIISLRWIENIVLYFFSYVSFNFSPTVEYLVKRTCGNEDVN